MFSPVKGTFESNNSEQSSKVLKLSESINNDISILHLDSHCVPSLPTINSPDVLFNSFITGPVDVTGDLLLDSIKSFTIL